MKILLLILSLPTENAAARMRAWRALKACGAAVLRDGVYLLPAGAGRRETLAEVETDVIASGGQAWLLEVEEADYPFAALFDRTEEYRRLVANIEGALADAATTAGPDLTRLVRKLRKGMAALQGIDFYPGEAARQAEARLAELEHELRAKSAPDEPRARAVVIQRLDPAAYRGRVWATRRRPWVDRLASAWLIRRFIDPAARILWLASPGDCPAEALGFDFDGAAFTHTEAFVTFETLLHSFGLEGDAALMRLGALVHHLDAGGLPVAESAGLEAMLAGLRASEPDDDALLEAAGKLFDWLCLTFRPDPAPGVPECQTCV
jgi:hypothetical protein